MSLCEGDNVGHTIPRNANILPITWSGDGPMLWSRTLIFPSLTKPNGRKSLW